MAGEAFLKHDGSGGLSETEATQAGGSGNEDKIPALDSNGRLDITMMPTGVGAETQSIEASETLVAGDLVNVWNDAGTPKVRKADATTAGKRAHGFVLSGYTATQSATVYFEGHVTGLSGLTGGDVYLSTTAGGTTNTAPVGSGNVVQRVGTATSATTVNFEPGIPVEIA